MLLYAGCVLHYEYIIPPKADVLQGSYVTNFQKKEGMHSGILRRPPAGFVSTALVVLRRIVIIRLS